MRLFNGLLRGTRSGSLAVIVCAAPAFSQAIVDRVPLPPIFNRLEPDSGDRLLACSLEPVKPSLSFGFRFRAGYVFRVPMTQFNQAAHRWTVLIEIIPDGAARPVHLVEIHRMPAAPKAKLEAESGGGYLLGEGHYRVRWTLVDDINRVCRKDWQVDVKLHHGEMSAKVAMPPNSVAEVSLLRGVGSANRHPDPGRPIRLTVLVDAAPLYQRRMTRAVLSPSDNVFLLSAVSALLERVPTSSVRVVAFNLEQQKELFRRDNFMLESLEEMSRSLSDLRLAAVDSHTLRNPQGHVQFVAKLINQELHATPPSDAVVFLGPRERYQDKVPAEAIDPVTNAVPQFFFLRYRPFQNPNRLLRPDPCDSSASMSGDAQQRNPGRGNPCVAAGTFSDNNGSFSNDTVSLAVKILKGKTIQIQSPGEYARAIEVIERRVGVISATQESTSIRPLIN
jgi:hypothetical protein